MDAPREEWKVVSDFRRTSYACGVTAGEKVQLRRILIITDHLGNETGRSFPAGSIWTVLNGSEEDASVIWLLNPNGKSHTWDDDASFWEWFERA